MLPLHYFHNHSCNANTSMLWPGRDSNPNLEVRSLLSFQLNDPVGFGFLYYIFCNYFFGIP